jgi:signal transduction histidine kinase/CheY-like chemotaxis protein
MTIDNIEKAEDFVKNLKRSDNWVSNEELLTKLNDSYKIILENGREDLLAYLGVHFSLYYIDIGDYNKAWEFTEIAKKHAAEYENNERLLDAISLQYRIQQFLGNLEKAQEIVNEQIDIAYKVNNIEQLASAYYNQGTLFHRQRLKNDAIEAFEKSIKLMFKSKNSFYTALFSIGYAGILLDFNEIIKAEKPLRFGLKIAKENNYLAPMALAFSNFGLLYEQQENEDKCIKSFKKCIQLYQQQQNTSGEITAKIMLADAYVNFNKLKEAEDILKQTIEFSERNGIKYNLIGIYEALSSLLEKQGNYKESLSHYKKLIQVKEEFLSNETDKRIRNLETTKRLDILKLEKESAEKMSTIKHDFLANMSHEIRTPINSILGICYLLQQQSLNTIQEDYVNRLKRSGENLLGIINDVLDISKIESGRMELVSTEFSINTLLNDVYNTLEPKANEKQLQFSIFKKYKNDIQVSGDSVRLYQVLLNFISNAIKFTSIGGVKVTISIKETINSSIFLIFKIQDTGIGIAKNKMNTIFERYEQADATIKTKFGGTGLGLSISKKIVELMNGIIDIKSNLNKGTTFILTIPFNISTKETNLNNISNKIDTRLLDNKVILIADDNEENRLVAKEILLSYNNTIKIMEACDGNEVISLLFKKIPDILFIDLDMPNLNGIETTQQIRKNRKYYKIKIIGNTASLSTFTDEEIKEIGFDGFLQKPYNTYNLLKAIID